MASAPTHIVATSAIAAFFQRPRVPWHLWLAGAVFAVAPDLDVLGTRFGVKYSDLLGHRGLTHSLLAALVVTGLFVFVFYRDGAGPLKARQVWLFLFLAMASHGVLDALTKGGLGVAFFSPFSEKRYFFPERPLTVSPLTIKQFLSSRGLAILVNEMKWVWAPTIGIAATALTYRSWRRRVHSAALKSRYGAKPRPAPRVAPPLPPPPPKRTPAPPPPPPRVAPPPRAPAPPPPAPQPLPLLDVAPAPEPEEPEPALEGALSTLPPLPAPVQRLLRSTVAGFQRALTTVKRHRGRAALIGGGVLVVIVGVFIAVQPTAQGPQVAEQAPAAVAPPPLPPKPTQAEAEGYYEPGYQFSVSGQRFIRLTLRPDPFITFARTGTQQEYGCFEQRITAQTVYLRCDIERVGDLTIDGRFVGRTATTRMDTPAISAILTVRNNRGEVLYNARDSFVWRPPQ